MTVPTIHSNGDSKKTLVDGLTGAYRALALAVESLQETSPNGRNYYPQGPVALQDAINEHLDRIMRVKSVHEEIEKLLIAVQDGGAK